MNKLKYLTAVLIAVAGLGLQQAHAGLNPGQEFFHTPFGSGTDEATFLIDAGYMDDCCQFLGKFDNDTGWEPGAIQNISQFITVTKTSGSEWHIEWHLSGSGFTMCGMLIKDGQGGAHGENLYSFFSVTDDQKVDGEGDVSFANGRNISHISFFGCAEGGVPDGGTTVMLLGVALSGLGLVRRYLVS
jgi:VPDSG-CTERM motif